MAKQPIYSVLDLVYVTETDTYRDAYLNSVAIAQKAEELGYHRYWIAEHHNIPGIASAATSVVMGYIANATKTIRIGSGGIMLPNHSPLVIAEQFGTLEAMYPGRIDLGLGRAPGTDPRTTLALRRGSHDQGDNYPQLLNELRHYLAPEENNKQADCDLVTEIPENILYRRNQNQTVRAFPGQGQDIPIWLLGTSGFTARLAGQLGLPYGFASHFMPNNLMQALSIYRDSFTPSEVLQKPKVLVTANVYASEDEDYANYIASSHQLSFLNLIRGNIGKLPKPVHNIDEYWTEIERRVVMQQLHATIIGTPKHVKNELQNLAKQTQADEIMIVSSAYSVADRIRTFEIVALEMIL